MLRKFLAFLGPASNSLKGVINFEELGRVFLTSLGAGALAAVIGAVAAVQADLPNIVEVPTLASVATMLLTQLLDFLRRLQHGAEIPG